MDNLYKELESKIKNAESIIIFSHVNPDGDTLGSNLALSRIIRKTYGKNADTVYIGSLPSAYSYLPGYEEFKNVSSIDSDKVYDLAIAVDVASKDRLVSGSHIYDSAKVRVNIDHHKTNVAYGDINIIESGAACVGTVLYKMFKALGVRIDLETARCLYTSLMTDTGCFKYENTTPETFIIASELLKIGVAPDKEYRACYETKPQSLIQFQAHIICNTTFYNNGKIAFSKITRSDMSKYNATDEYTEGIVEVLRTSKDVEIAAILKETNDGYTKVSLRSKRIDLTPIVIEFGGGGHKFAAGCTIKKPVAIAYDKLLKRVQSEIE